MDLDWLVVFVWGRLARGTCAGGLRWLLLGFGSYSFFFINQLVKGITVYLTLTQSTAGVGPAGPAPAAWVKTSMTKFSKVWGDKDVRRCLDEHLLLNFNRLGLLLPHEHRKKARFARSFIADVVRLGGDGAAARLVLADLTEQEDDQAELRASSMCVQYPFSRGLVAGHKTCELRKRGLGMKFKGKRTELFVNESQTRRLQFAASPPCRPFLGRCPGEVIGTVVLLGTWTQLTPAQLTEEMASRTMLTLDGLKSAYKAGYKCSWDVGDAVEFKRGYGGKDFSCKRKMAQTFTNMDWPPLKRIKRAH